MLLGKDRLRRVLQQVLAQRIAQGADLDVRVFSERIESASDSYDALYALSLELREPPLRADWDYCEPTDWEGIRAESEQLDPEQPWPQPDLAVAAERVRAGFLGSVCGCMLGKPVEIDPTLAELKAAAGPDQGWPLDDYISEAFLERLGRRHDSWQQTTRENIDGVAADDDLHYTLLGMLVLEEKGPAFNQEDLYKLWQLNLAPGWTWGPERSALLSLGLQSHHFFLGAPLEEFHDTLWLNPGDEMCGALIRADAYGYACPGNPDLAAWLAWKDASFSHTRTGVYGAMFIAALIAQCHGAGLLPAGNERLELVREAMRRIPTRTRFAEVLRDCLEKVAAETDWEAGYEAVHGQYREYSHCQVYQEIGTLVNTLKFAEHVGHGIGIQVSQGNDTDSFGATAGSVLGVMFGPGHLEDRWLDPFGGKIRLSLADFHEQSLHTVAERVSMLPELVYFRETVQNR